MQAVMVQGEQLSSVETREEEEKKTEKEKKTESICVSIANLWPQFELGDPQMK
jgi:hypothetical protein